MTGAIAEALAGPNAPPSVAARIGIVLASPAATATDVTVSIDGQAHRFPFQAPYVPVAGDEVNVLLIGGSGSSMTGIVLGGRSGTSGNVVLNPRFEHAPQFPQPIATSLPYHWTHYTASGQAATVAGQFDGSHIRPLLMIQHTTGLSGDQYVYSAAFPVTPGETLYADLVGDFTTFAGGLGQTTLTIELRLAWFVAAESAYPYTVSETLIDSVTDTGDLTGAWLGASATVPATANFGRAMVRTNQTGGNLLYHGEVGEISVRREPD